MVEQGAPGIILNLKVGRAVGVRFTVVEFDQAIQNQIAFFLYQKTSNFGQEGSIKSLRSFPLFDMYEIWLDKYEQDGQTIFPFGNKKALQNQKDYARIP